MSLHVSGIRDSAESAGTATTSPGDEPSTPSLPSDRSSPTSSRRRWRGVVVALAVAVVGFACVEWQAASRRVSFPVVVRVEGIPAPTDADRWRVTQVVLDESRARQAARDAAGPRSAEVIVAMARERLASLTLEWQPGTKPGEVDLILHDDAGTSPHETVAFVNRLAELVAAELHDERLSQAESAYRQCEQQASIAGDDAERAWNQLTSFAERERVVSPGDSPSPVKTESTATRSQHSPPEHAPPAMSPEELAARDALTALRLKEADLLRRLQPAHPQAIEIARQREAAETHLAAIQSRQQSTPPVAPTHLEAAEAGPKVAAAAPQRSESLPVQKRAVFEQRIANYYRANSAHAEATAASQAAWRDWVDARTSPGPILRPATVPSATEPPPRWPWHLVTLGIALAAGGATVLLGSEQTAEGDEAAEGTGLPLGEETLNGDATPREEESEAASDAESDGPRLAEWDDDDSCDDRLSA